MVRKDSITVVFPGNGSTYSPKKCSTHTMVFLRILPRKYLRVYDLVLYGFILYYKLEKVIISLNIILFAKYIVMVECIIISLATTKCGDRRTSLFPSQNFWCCVHICFTYDPYNVTYIIYILPVHSDRKKSTEDFSTEVANHILK